jgi:hypothetical protein
VPGIVKSAPGGLAGHGRVVLALAIPYFSETLPGSLIAEHARLLVHAAGLVTREIRGEAERVS